MGYRHIHLLIIVFVAHLFHSIPRTDSGTLLGQKDLKFLQNMYAIFFFTVPAYMLRLKYRALSGVQAVGIGTMWAAFSTYNLIRTSIWHLRLALLQRRTDRGAVAVDGDHVNNVNEDEVNR